MKIQLKESVFVPCDYMEDPILKTIKKKKKKPSYNQFKKKM